MRRRRLDGEGRCSHLLGGDKGLAVRAQLVASFLVTVIQDIVRDLVHARDVLGQRPVADTHIQRHHTACPYYTMDRTRSIRFVFPVSC